MVRAGQPPPRVRVAGQRGKKLLSGFCVAQHEFESAGIERRGKTNVLKLQRQRNGLSRPGLGTIAAGNQLQPIAQPALDVFQAALRNPIVVDVRVVGLVQKRVV